MKYISTIFLSATFLITVSAQVATNPFVDQFMISLNSTLEKSNITENRIGFGLGIYHTVLPKNRLNFNVGLEFNRTRQFEKAENLGHFGNYNDLTYSKNCLSTPINFRMTLGQKVKYFFEVGGFWDWVISSKRKGKLHTYVPDGDGQVQHKYFDINENAGLVSSFGFSFGPGIQIQSKYFDIIIKPDYKQKLNKGHFTKDLVLSKYLRLNMGITLK